MKKKKKAETIEYLIQYLIPYKCTFTVFYTHMGNSTPTSLRARNMAVLVLRQQCSRGRNKTATSSQKSRLGRKAI